MACLSQIVALSACAAMAILYVGLLYIPPLLPCLHPQTQRNRLLGRFVSAAIASVVAPVFAFHILPIKASQKEGLLLFLKTFGLRNDYMLQAFLNPLLLTAILYLGPIAMGILDMLLVWKEETGSASSRGECFESPYKIILAEAKRLTSDIFAWRNYVMAPISEEVVFRACMTPILLCGKFSLPWVVFISPTFFGLAHLHHFLELVYLQNYQKDRAMLIVGVQLCYTTVFGWYATLLYLRTGHLVSPIVAHIFCNVMGLPDVGRALRKRERQF